VGISIRPGTTPEKFCQPHGIGNKEGREDLRLRGGPKPKEKVNRLPKSDLDGEYKEREGGGEQGGGRQISSDRATLEII